MELFHQLEEPEEPEQSAQCAQYEQEDASEQSAQCAQSEPSEQPEQMQLLQTLKQLNPKRSWLLGQGDNRYWNAFFCCALAAVGVFLPLTIIDGGFFHYAGDFNSQQITFYTYMNAFVKEGGTFSWATDLGSGAMNAYSFYLCGSPFFWVSLLFPSDWIPYLMSPLLILKIAVAGGGAYLYLRRYAKNQDFAVIAACLYALSGFSFYNAFFNHFVDVVALFPYLLWSLDAAIYDKKRGWFGVLLALNFINNYFFFVGQVLFICIYFFCKLASGAYKLNRKLFTCLAVETLLGAGMGMIMAWPAFLSVMQNPRTINFSSGYGFLMYNDPQQYFAILYSWLLPPDSPYISSMWDGGVVKWTSLTAYLPMCSLAGVFAYWNSRGATWVKRVLFTCAICALVPVLNSAFYALNSSFYARWYYMPILMMSLATMIALEDTKALFYKNTVTVGLLMLTSVAFALVPVYDSTEQTWSIGTLANAGQYYIVLFLGLVGLCLFALVNEVWRGTKMYPQVLAVVLLAFACLYGFCHISIGKFGQWKNDSDLDAQYTGAQELAALLPDTDDYRIDTYQTHDNLAMWMDMSGLQCFNSTVAPSILTFYPSVGVTRDVISKPEVSYYALRGLLGVRYTIMPLDEEENFLAEEVPGWTHYLQTEAFVVYENENALPLAYAYEYYITEAQTEHVSDTQQGTLYLRGILLSAEQIEALADFGITSLSKLPTDLLGDFDYDSYTQDVADRAAMACDEFVMTNDGFTTSITLTEANLVFFAVPYDDGFTALVNGEEVEIWNVDSGLMAVPCPAGENEIAITYQADGLMESSILFWVSAGLYLVYLRVIIWNRRRTKENWINLTSTKEGGAIGEEKC
ncbi:MAG: YfhO family protein [Faecalibacterium sp.]